MSAGVELTTTERVRSVCDMAAELAANNPVEAHVQQVRSRLDGPLRVAIAGRVKAGKSTLLNALVGERLAPTDAGECTTIVTWYQRGNSYTVEAVGYDGTVTALPFRRVDGALTFDVSGRPVEEIERIVVSWPSSALDRLTLIDTPGLASMASENSLRTSEFLAMNDSRPSEADAVIYLMRHLHKRDAEFLGAFMDRSVAGASPVNAVAVLSRADEIGAGRLDAMASAHRIAHRYENDATVRTLCTAVKPVAGLIAETGLTLREDEAAALRLLASTPTPVLTRMLRAADAFCDPASSELTVESRRQLLDRLGVFGVRFCVAEICAGRASTANDLSRSLVAESGLGALHGLIDDLFMPRAHVLKARTALIALRTIARDLEVVDMAGARRLAAEVERCESSSPEFAQLRLSHLVMSGIVSFTDEQRNELEALCDTTGSPERRLRAGDDIEHGALRATALQGIERWRTTGAAPMADVAMKEACETMAHTYESMFVQLHAPR